MSKILRFALPIPVALALVALAMVWSAQPPALGSMTVDGRSFSLGTTPIGEYQHHSWVIRNEGSKPLKLRTRFTKGRCGFSLWLGADHFVPAGGSLTVSLTCPTPGRGSISYSGYADVLSNDPENPRIRFRVFGITARSDVP